MQNCEYFDRSEERMDQKTTDTTVQNQNDSMVVRLCQKAYVEAHQGVQFVSDGHMVRSFQTSFFDTSECNDHINGENIENE